MIRAARPLPPRGFFVSILLIAATVPLGAHAAIQCPGREIDLQYTADSLPEQAPSPWKMLGQGPESVSGSILTLGGTRQAYRVEDVGGLSHAFSMKARVQLVPGQSAAFAVGAIAQTKSAVFALAAAKGGMSVLLLGGKQVTTLGTLPFDATARLVSGEAHGGVPGE